MKAGVSNSKTPATGRILTHSDKSKLPSGAQWTRKGEAEDRLEMRAEGPVGRAAGPQHLGEEFGFYSKCDRKPLEGSEQGVG